MKKQVTLREYAQMHKLSYFNVMKMVRTQKVKTVSVEENGTEVEYIVLEEEQEKKVSENILDASEKNMTLAEENKLLKKEILRLKAELEKCNKRTVLA
jgi:molecular chaperone GrpE (heat shock protein)